MRAQNDLKWLPVIVARHGKQGGLERDDPKHDCKYLLQSLLDSYEIHTIDFISDRPCLLEFKIIIERRTGQEIDAGQCEIDRVSNKFEMQWSFTMENGISNPEIWR